MRQRECVCVCITESAERAKLLLTAEPDQLFCSVLSAVVASILRKVLIIYFGEFLFVKINNSPLLEMLVQ